MSSSSDSSKLVLIASSLALAAGALWFLSQDEREEVVFDASKHDVEALLHLLETVLHDVIIVHSEAL